MRTNIQRSFVGLLALALLIAVMSGCSGGSGVGTTTSTQTGTSGASASGTTSSSVPGVVASSSTSTSTTTGTSNLTLMVALDTQSSTARKATVAAVASSSPDPCGSLGIPMAIGPTVTSFKVTVNDRSTEAQVGPTLTVPRTQGASTQTITIPSLPDDRAVRITLFAFDATGTEVGYFQAQSLVAGTQTIAVSQVLPAVPSDCDPGVGSPFPTPPPSGSPSPSPSASPVVVSLAIAPMLPSVPKGLTQAFTATATMSDGSFLDVTTDATWSSSNPQQATISNQAGSNGVATCVSVGSSTIQATFQGQSPSTTLTVTPAVVTSIAVSPSSPTFPWGATQQFTAQATFDDGTTGDVTSLVTFTSTNDLALSITSQGFATTTGSGQAQVIATAANGVVGQTTATVTAAVIASITVSPPDSTMDGQQQFTARGTYTNGTVSDITSQVTFTSSNNLVVTITPQGFASVTEPVVTGQAQIIATASNGVTGHTTVFTAILFF